MFTIKKEYDSIINFEFWSGAETQFSEMTEDEINYLDEYLEEISCDGELTETEVNDLIWFESEEILRQAYLEGVLKLPIHYMKEIWNEFNEPETMVECWLSDDRIYESDHATEDFEEVGIFCEWYPEELEEKRQSE